MHLLNRKGGKFCIYCNTSRHRLVKYSFSPDIVKSDQVSKFSNDVCSRSCSSLGRYSNTTEEKFIRQNTFYPVKGDLLKLDLRNHEMPKEWGKKPLATSTIF